MHDKRPSDRELTKRLNEAKEFLKNRHGVFAEISKAYGELNDLDIGNSDDIWDLIKELLEEISPNDYAGTRPLRRNKASAKVLRKNNCRS